MTEKNPHLEELGKFLKARRSALSPEEFGLPAGEPGTRRVSGLRREEVAARVAISHDYYSRIEQGRLAPSEPVLETLGHMLRLTPDERAYAEGLAKQADRRTVPRRRPVPPRPQIQRLLDHLTLTPAFVVGKYLDYIAWNPLAGELLLGLDSMAPHERNYVRMLFADPRMKDFYQDWDGMARTGVALLRMQAVENPHDPGLSSWSGNSPSGTPSSGSGGPTAASRARTLGARPSSIPSSASSPSTGTAITGQATQTSTSRSGRPNLARRARRSFASSAPGSRTLMPPGTAGQGSSNDPTESRSGQGGRTGIRLGFSCTTSACFR